MFVADKRGTAQIAAGSIDTHVFDGGGRAAGRAVDLRAARVAGHHVHAAAVSAAVRIVSAHIFATKYG